MQSWGHYVSKIQRDSELAGFIGDQILTCNPLRTEWFGSVSRLEPELDDSRHQHQPLGMKQKLWEVMGCVEDCLGE